MNERFNVCAGWLKDNPVIGTCYIDRIRGEEIISFQYNREWLLNNHIVIDPNLSEITGRQYPPQNHTFGFLEDISPDRWGRRLIDRKESRDAVNENRKAHTLLASDYLLGVSDICRTGGIRLCNEDGIFINSDDANYIPPITELRRLENAVQCVEKNQGNIDPYLKDLLAPGSSLGGARPKANVIDVDGSIWIAKFPSKNDDYNVGAWEMVAHDMAKMCGISVPTAKVLNLSGVGSTFLVKRFDRNNGQRLHYASAMTMLGEHDNSDNKTGYLDIVSVLGKIGADFNTDTRYLFERLVFNICVGNTDDHLRNHGFILTDKGWRLSAAFDINPSLYKDNMSLLVDFDSNDKSLDLAMSVSELFGYESQEALEYIHMVQGKFRTALPSVAKTCGLSRSDIEFMNGSFSECYREVSLGHSVVVNTFNATETDDYIKPVEYNGYNADIYDDRIVIKDPDGSETQITDMDDVDSINSEADLREYLERYIDNLDLGCER